MEKNEKTLNEQTMNASVDYLTGFANRRGLYDQFELLPDDADINFMFLDIDNFKSVNDTYGHATGDKLLIAVSKMIKEKIGNSMLARIGGDEFVIMPMQGLMEYEIVKIAESILCSVNDIDISIEIKSIISFSIGIVMNQKKSIGMDAIMPKCDAAMYEAKRRGKNGYVFYSSIEDVFEMKQLVDREKAQALYTGKFAVRYIPVMNMASSTMIAAKTTIVWNRNGQVWHEEMFKEIMEENGFIIELERYAFAQTCAMLASIKAPKLKRVPVVFSVSGINVNRIDFVQEMLHMAEECGVNPGNIIIQLDDINERIDTRRVEYFFESIKEAGFKTSVKGFADNGFSVMTLKNLKLDYVAVGKELIGDLLKDRVNNLFVKNILSLINDLNLETMADGIDDAMQVRYLSTYGCNIGSGLLFSDALDAEEYKNYGEKNIPELLQCIKFKFQNDLKDDTGKYEGTYFGDKPLEFVYDEELKRNVLHLQGGKVFENVIEFPKQLMHNASYTIVIRFKVKTMINWSSLIYASYENGFMSFMPYAWNGIAMYRIKDDMDPDGWNDAMGENADYKWHTAVLTFSHKNSTCRLYMDGKCISTKDNVINLATPRRIVIGGDIYVNSFEGYVDKIDFYDYVLDSRDIEHCFCDHD